MKTNSAMSYTNRKESRRGTVADGREKQRKEL